MAGPLSFVPRKARSQLCASMIVRDVCDYLLNLTPTFIFTFTCSRRCASFFFSFFVRRGEPLTLFFPDSDIRRRTAGGHCSGHFRSAEPLVVRDIALCWLIASVTCNWACLFICLFVCIRR